MTADERRLKRHLAEFAKNRPLFETIRRRMGEMMEARKNLTLERAYTLACLEHRKSGPRP